MFSTIPKAVYQRVANVLFPSGTPHADISYLKLCEKGFHPRNDPMSPSHYPRLFLEFGGISKPVLIRHPAHYLYYVTVNIVTMTMADALSFDDLVFNEGTNTNMGIGDIATTIGNILWTTLHGDFGVSGVSSREEWVIERVGMPTVPHIQRLLYTSDLIRGEQVDLVVPCEEHG